MITKNIYAPVTKDSTTVHDINQAGQITKSGHLLFYKGYDKGSPSDSLILPSKDYELVAPNGGYIKRNEILKYSLNGNPLEAISKDGIHSCYIWGYSDQYLVASIANASFNGSGDIVSGGNTFIQSK